MNIIQLAEAFLTLETTSRIARVGTTLGHVCYFTARTSEDKPVFYRFKRVNNDGVELWRHNPTTDQWDFVSEMTERMLRQLWEEHQFELSASDDEPDDYS